LEAEGYGGRNCGNSVDWNHFLLPAFPKIPLKGLIAPNPGYFLLLEPQEGRFSVLAMWASKGG